MTRSVGLATLERALRAGRCSVEMTALGHAGLQIAGAHTVGLVDPWFDRSGAFLGSWYQLPNNDHLLTPALLRPDWVVVSGGGADRCDLSTLTRLAPGTPVFVPASHSGLTARLRSTRLRVVEVPPSVPVDLDGDGSRLTFVPAEGPPTMPSSIVLGVDRVTLLVCAPIPPSGAHLHGISPTVSGQFDVVAVQVARAARDPLCEEATTSTLRSRSARLLSAALEEACATVRAARAPVVVPHGGPPCFLDPELANLNQWISSGLLPDVEQAAELLRSRLPGRRVTTLLPGDRLFPTEDLVVDDSRWHGFSFVRLHDYLRDYAYARAVDLSRVHSRFPDPDDSLGHGFAAHVAQLVAEVGDTTDHLRFEVTGPGGGDWDVVVDGRSASVDLTGRRSAATGRIRVASKWLAAVVDGRVGWRDLLRSFRYSVVHVGDRHDDPLLEMLEHADVAGAGRTATDRTVRAPTSG